MCEYLYATCITMDIRTVMTLPSWPANIMEFRENIVSQALCWFSNDAIHKDNGKICIMTKKGGNFSKLLGRGQGIFVPIKNIFRKKSKSKIRLFLKVHF